MINCRRRRSSSRKWLTLLALCANFVQLIRSQRIHSTSCGQNNALDGFPVTSLLENWPWLVSVGHTGGDDVDGWTHRCSGSIVSNRHIVTAAHCALMDNWSIQFGFPDSEHSFRRPIKRSHVHPKYDRRDVAVHFDVAVIEVEPFEFTTFARPVCVPEENELFFRDSFKGRRVTVQGWDEEDGEMAVLHKLAKIYSTKMCNYTLFSSSLDPAAQMEVRDLLPDGVSDEVLCAGFVGATDDHDGWSGGACPSSSGAPSVRFFRDASNWGYYKQLGLVVGGAGGCDRVGVVDFRVSGKDEEEEEAATRLPSVFVRLDHPEVGAFVREKAQLDAEIKVKKSGGNNDDDEGTKRENDIGSDDKKKITEEEEKPPSSAATEGPSFAWVSVSSSISSTSTATETSVTSGQTTTTGRSTTTSTTSSPPTVSTEVSTSQDLREDEDVSEVDANDLEDDPVVLDDPALVNAGLMASAIELGSLSTLKAMLDGGQDPNAVYNATTLYAPLHLACLYNQTEAVTMLLEMEEADLDAKAVMGHSPLHFCSRNGLTEAVDALIDAGADVNSKDGNGTTSLMEACYHENLDTCELLLDRGANVLAVTTSHGRNVLHYAVIRANEHVINLLLDSGADWAKEDVFGITPFSLACGFGRVQIVRNMLANGQATLRNADARGVTPLMRAAGYGHFAVMELLLEKDPSLVSDADVRGRTALHHAAAAGEEAAVSELLRHGADRVAEDLDGRTPEDYARDAGHDGVADLIAFF